MSVAIKRGISAKAESRKCAARFWRLFPHLVLCLSLVGYAALGALMFQYIEGGVPSVPQDYSEFLGKIITKVQSLTENASCTHQNIVKEVEGDMKGGFKSIWLQNRDRWSFFGSMFFCCTVFTTVGYGEIYPVTLLGKVVCVLYAMVGIPLMLLVILDVGDFLAMLMTRAYIQIHTFFKDFRSHKWSPRQEERRVDTLSCRTLEDGTFVFSHDVVGLSEPLDIRQVLHSQADIRQKSIQLQNNKEIFEKILAREDLLRKGPLLRTLSCPELARMPHKYRGYTIWDFTGLGDGMETLDVPFILILFIVFAYILFGGLILPLWETEFKGFDPYYFCFITLTTIGFGDIIPNHPKYFLLTSLFIIVGMAIMSMAFKLCQTRLVICYRQCIKFISRGNAETFIKEDSD
ncbi:potassium channel subfamily K member 18 isoform X1 [Notolabrus celidotus]|uniref:potassium channel subfamily K member 18 isoform X1 n=1 Tax=Notolabrus celidotus TaxID=1203425 RepID=UPI00148FDC75|nr:potassium channel subfamily K member 18 isoform X1 [Notolabrus celidotus]